jgi:hypothetical protein
MLHKKEPPTHTAWSQHRERGQFREWYKTGHVWLEKTPEGQIVGVVFEAAHMRGGDGFTWFFPVGMQPPDPPPEPQRPDRQQGTE